MKNDLTESYITFLYITKMYKKVTIPKTKLEEVVDSVCSSHACKKISVYADEFYLSMIRLFFPNIESKSGYIEDSIALTNKINRVLIKKHKILIVIGGVIPPEFVDLAKKIDVIDEFKIVYLKDDENALVEYSYMSTLFPPRTGLDRNKLQITSIGVYSVTSYKSNLETVDLISKRMGKNITIMDATACVGGDTIGFAMNFDKVISIERDNINYGALVHNIKMYGLDNVETFNGNFLDIYNNIINNQKPDVVYFDPPWGGKDYYKTDKLDLFLDNKNIKEIVGDIIGRVKLVVLKVPTNFNYDDVDKLGDVSIHKLKKFDIVLISNK